MNELERLNEACADCGGKGTVVYPRSKYENGPGTCPACGGSGVDPDPKEAEDE